MGIKEENCFHLAFVNNRCVTCGEKANDKNTFIANNIHASPIPANINEINKLKYENTKKILSQRKLHLVLDLDHTLLHSINPRHVRRREEYLTKNIDTTRDVTIEKFSLSYVKSVNMLTKTRPFVQEFLKQASTMFEMYIYTTKSRACANEMAKILDPEGVYFGSRIISSDECNRGERNGFDVILAKERATLIVNSDYHMWPINTKNLLVIEKYIYFARDLPCDRLSLAEMEKCGESEGDDTLRHVLETLKEVHTDFFEEVGGSKISDRDVRKVLEAIIFDDLCLEE